MRLALIFVLALLATACAAQSPASASVLPQVSTPDASGLTLPPGYQAQIVASGLNAPTHAAVGPDGALYITQLNGGENDGKGQVVRVPFGASPATPSPTPEVMISNLLKPTGLTWIGNTLYIVSSTTILASHFQDGKFDTPTAMYKDLPFNGRSEGQIFTGPDGMLYFESTGNEGNWRNSGVIYRAKPDGSSLTVYARGLKNAYSLAWDKVSGRMYSTEIGDGAIPNVGQPPEELNIIQQGGNYGWPQCYANQKENSAFGGDRNICADTDVPLAMFPPESTPTGLAVFDGKLIVALWQGNPARLVSIDPASGAVAEYASGFRRPIALLVDPSGGLLVVDFDGGTIYDMTKR